jgi:hypothetical protein
VEEAGAEADLPTSVSGNVDLEDNRRERKGGSTPESVRALELSAACDITPVSSPNELEFSPAELDTGSTTDSSLGFLKEVGKRRILDRRRAPALL